MSHSVAAHLAVSPAAYDAEIERLVPGYAAMLDEVMGALAEHLPATGGRVLDLGAGTGALAAQVAARFPSVQLTLIDADAAMLAQARGRLAADLHRLELRHGSFTEPLPTCHAVVASLALHHLHTAESKREVYRSIFGALVPGGVFINADASVPRAGALAEPLRRRWAAHLVAHGDTERQAFARFEQWAIEDRYFGLDEELDLMRQAGFEQLDLRWRSGPMAVMVARRD